MRAGAPVAAVAATTPEIAGDALRAIKVTYEVLPHLVREADLSKAGERAKPAAEQVVGDPTKALSEAEVVTEGTYSIAVITHCCLESHGQITEWEGEDKLNVFPSTQAVSRLAGEFAKPLDIPETNVRVRMNHIGGGFGSKGPLYREYVLICHLALKLGRPVKWIATRSEDFVTTIQGRDQAMTSELALKRDGTMLGLKVRVVANLGAYLYSSTAGPPQRMMAMAPGCYRIPNVHVEVVAVFTNTIPTGPYRGAGRPESVLNIERLVDKASRELGLDRLEIRRKNFIRSDEFPYRTGVSVEYDSGDYEKSLSEALRLSDYETIIRYRDQARSRGELVGVGVSTFVEPSGGAGFESGTVRVERTGEITVLTGSSSHGQGHETIFAQVAAEKMRVSMDHVAVRHGDTVAVQQGVGTFGSRSAVMGGGSMAIAIDRVIQKARRIAAHLMEASPDDIVQADGGFAIAGVPEKKVTWRQIAAAGYGGRLPAGMEPGLQETAFFDPRREAWGFGCHVALVRIDREAGL